MEISECLNNLTEKSVKARDTEHRKCEWEFFSQSEQARGEPLVAVGYFFHCRACRNTKRNKGNLVEFKCLLLEMNNLDKRHSLGYPGEEFMMYFPSSFCLSFHRLLQCKSP
jgi:hypothetical protein